MADELQQLTTARATDVLTSTDRSSVGVVRILSDDAGKPGSEREYAAGDEALVEAGRAEWVVAPVHLPEAGRRLDHDAEREATPLGGVEVYPPAEPTTPDRRGEARVEGYVDAHSEEGLAERLEGQRRDLARQDAAGDSGDDVKTQAALGGSGARSGPVTDAASDLTPEKLTGADAAAADKQAADKAASDKAAADKAAAKSKA